MTENHTTPAKKKKRGTARGKFTLDKPTPNHPNPHKLGPEYAREYNAGWKASARVGATGNPSKAWDSGTTSDAWDDGYLDQANGREKWHLRDCPSHVTCG